MKKIFALILCTLLVCMTPIVVSAEGDSAIATEPSEAVTETLPSENETATEGENSASEETVTETIVGYVKSHFEEITVVGTLILTVFYEIRKHRKLNGSIGTLNNNAIAVAESSAKTIKAALAEVEDIGNVVKSYKDEFLVLLTEIRKSAEEKKSLEETLKHVESFLKTAKLATLELSNEVAELLVLANIPNSKKEELYARHTKAVHELEAAEEVTSNDGSEA